MATANLQETLISYTLRKNELNLEITQLQAQKSLATYAQADAHSVLSSEKHSIREYYKKLFEESPELQEKYHDYTEIAEFEEEIDKITANYQDQLDELTAWETIVDNEITTKSAELEEIMAYEESIKSMLSSNIQEDFNYGLNN